MMAYGLVSIILFLGAVYIMADAIRRRNLFHCIVCAINAAASYVVLQLLQRDGSNGHISSLYAVPLAVITAAQFVFFMQMRKHKNTQVTVMSIKEAVDMLSDGLCYYYDDGRVKLVNHTMNVIAGDVLSGNVTDGVRLWEYLLQGRSSGGEFLQTGEKPVFRTSGNSVYSITLSKKQMSGTYVNELIATDITDEYTLQEKLNEKNERLMQQKKRLLEMNERITDLTIEKEILQAKINIHDDLGKSLIAIRQYMSGSIDRNDMLYTVDKNIRLLDAQGSPDTVDDYAAVMRAAKDVGIGINITGVLPNDPDNRQVVSAALRECITNTFRHAGGDKLFVNVIRDDGCGTVVEFTNNGADPEDEIKESGGLASLRDLAEQKGVRMTVVSKPHFSLRLELLPVVSTDG